mmetsp:Transcript_45585/g.114910  ORF Transcript_45585/g.114910 Transcript_45585/m.114910 type:complete len:206 (+) Transcript_45585:1629-2246(+)
MTGTPCSGSARPSSSTTLQTTRISHRMWRSQHGVAGTVTLSLACRTLAVARHALAQSLQTCVTIRSTAARCARSAQQHAVSAWGQRFHRQHQHQRLPRPLHRHLRRPLRRALRQLLHRPLRRHLHRASSRHLCRHLCRHKHQHRCRRLRQRPRLRLLRLRRRLRQHLCLHPRRHQCQDLRRRLCRRRCQRRRQLLMIAASLPGSR